MISGIVLAAGSGSRLGRPKAELAVGGERLLDRAVRVLREAGCTEIVAVVRPGTAVDGARVIVNDDPDRGMSSSLRLGLGAAGGERAVVLLVDTPGVDADAVRAVLAVDAPVAVATYAGQRGHPVAFARDVWPEVADSADGDEGARSFLRAHPHLVREVPCAGDPSDLDTVEHLRRWQGELTVRPLGEDDVDWVAEFAVERWGDTFVVSRGRAVELAGLPGLLAERAGERVGLLTRSEPDNAGHVEVVSVDAIAEGEGIGRTLLEALAADARRNGWRRLWLVTTNDNTRALRFYQRNGWDLVAVHRDAVSAARRIKPSIPETADGIPLRHELELEFYP